MVGRRFKTRRVPPTTDLPPLPISAAAWRHVSKQLQLSPQQIIIVELILRGQRDKQIAAVMKIGLPTIRTYLARIYARLAVRDRVGLILHVVAKASSVEAENSCHQS